jgi:inorganic pyrophosphatase
MYITADSTSDDVKTMFEMIAGYGLGGSTVALFGRVGGGIYTKAADVGSDLAGKVVAGLEEDDPSNPGVIADNVGDNVGDIAGMGADLFGSLAESTCAALVVASTSEELVSNVDAMYFPLMVTSVGILVSFVTTFFATRFTKVKYDTVESTVKWQLIISTLLMTVALIPIIYVLPATFRVGTTTSTDSDGNDIIGVVCTQWKAYGCIMCGLWSGLLIGYVTEMFTSNMYSPV